MNIQVAMKQDRDSPKKYLYVSQGESDLVSKLTVDLPLKKRHLKRSAVKGDEIDKQRALKLFVNNRIPL
jgi:hypothetical protein